MLAHNGHLINISPTFVESLISSIKVISVESCCNVQRSWTERMPGTIAPTVSKSLLHLFWFQPLRANLGQVAKRSLCHLLSTISYSLCQEHPRSKLSPFLESTLWGGVITLASHALWGLLPKSSGWALTSSQRRKLLSFTEKPGPAVNCCFLVLTSAWLPRAQCTQNYNVIRQAGAERGQLLRKMHTRGREVQRPF